MSKSEGWTHSERELRGQLTAAHRALHRASRHARRDRDARAAADAAESSRPVREIRRMNRKRRLEEALDAQHRRRVGAAIRRIERSDAYRAKVAANRHHKMFESEASRASKSGRPERDLYFEFIARGVSKGKRSRSDGKSRLAARAARWRDREFQDKILYIEREDALENVQGNIVSNMGTVQGERLGCAERIEYLEPLSRKNANVYNHVILALPADLSPEGRADVLRRLCGHLDRLGLPHVAALHKPDPGGDEKNFHAHILLSLRPMCREDNEWRFALTKQTWLNTPAGLKLQRRVIAREFNRALKAEKAAARWTHRSRADDGLLPASNTKREGLVRTFLQKESHASPFQRRLNEVLERDASRLDDLADRICAIVRELSAADEILFQAERKALEMPDSVEGPALANATPAESAPPIANSQFQARPTAPMKESLEFDGTSIADSQSARSDEEVTDEEPGLLDELATRSQSFEQAMRELEIRLLHFKRLREEKRAILARGPENPRQAFEEDADKIEAMIRMGLRVTPSSNPDEIDLWLPKPERREISNINKNSLPIFEILSDLAQFSESEFDRSSFAEITQSRPKRKLSLHEMAAFLSPGGRGV